MLILKIVISACLFLISVSSMADEAVKHEDSAKNIVVQKSIGTAYTKEKKFFYLEEDNIEIVDDHIRKIDSVYKDKDSKLIAEMHADFSKKPYFPEITFNDHRREVGFKMLLIDKENAIKVSQNLKDSTEIKSKSLDYNDKMMNSMGLINYIRENIAALKSAKKYFRYVVPALMDDYGMNLEFRENTDKSDTSVRFAFQLESFFIRSLSGVKESSLSFDENKKFIKSFNGVSNILDESNKPVEVALIYLDPTETKTK